MVSRPLYGAIVNKAIVGHEISSNTSWNSCLISFFFPLYCDDLCPQGHPAFFKKMLSSYVSVYALGDSDLCTLGPVFNISHTRS